MDVSLLSIVVYICILYKYLKIVYCVHPDWTTDQCFGLKS